MGLGLRDLRVWQEATALAADTVRSFSKTRPEVRALTERAMLTAAAVAEHVAEGFGERKPAEQEKCFQAAKAELLKVETLLAIARAAEVLSASRHAEIVARIATVSRLLSGFLVYLDRQTKEPVAAEAQSTW